MEKENRGAGKNLVHLWSLGYQRDFSVLGNL